MKQYIVGMLLSSICIAGLSGCGKSKEEKTAEKIIAYKEARRAKKEAFYKDQLNKREQQWKDDSAEMREFLEKSKARRKARELAMKKADEEFKRQHQSKSR